MNRLLACRVCLAYDTRMCSIVDGHLREIYEKLVEASLNMKDMLPTSVCYICFASMKKIVQFRHRSQKANQILQQMISSGLEPSVSSLAMLVKDQAGISWTLGMSDVEWTTTTSGEIEVQVKIESVKTEMDIDEMSDRNEDYSDSRPVCRDSTSDSEDDLPLQNKSEQCKTDRVKIVKTLLAKISGHEGAAPPDKRKLDNNEAGNELVNIRATLRSTEKEEETKENKEVKKNIPALKGSKNKLSHLKIISKETETTTSKIISEHQKDSAFNKNYTVTPPKDIFTCNLCKYEFQSKILLESHIKKSHVIKLNPKDSINSDSNVTKKCKRTNLLKAQEIQNNDNPKEKDWCENKFRDNTRQYVCQFCMKRYSSNSHLTLHLRIHTKEKPYTCDICEKGFIHTGHLTRHLRVHTKEKPFKCDICEKGFSQSSNLISHLSVHTKEKPFKCDACEKGFSRKEILIKHLRFHTKEKPLKCDICKKAFSHRNTLTYHLKGHTQEKPKEKPFKCDTCEKGFSDRTALSVHLRSHTKEKPFKCDVCEKSFSQTHHLTRHLRVHTKEKPFKCDICEKRFTQSSSLTQHLRVHTQEKPFKCDICEKSFSTSGSLTAHLRVHTKAKPFKCDICEKGFSQSGHLNRHLRVHTKEKPFKCTICEKGFSENSTLTQHLRVHTKEKPFKCTICEKGFSESSTLTQHLESTPKKSLLNVIYVRKAFLYLVI